MFGLPSIPSIPGTSNRTAIVALVFTVALLLTAIGCYLYGSHRGYAEAEALGKAELKTLEADYAKASANATAEAMQETARLAKRGNELSAKLITTRSELDQARAAITRRINDVAQTVSAACVLGPEYVGLRNEAFYGLRSRAAANATDPSGDQGRPGEAGRVRAGLPEGASVADSLTWERDMGDYVRKLEAVSAARLKLLEAWAQ
ncbi:MAG: hypothetical protein KKF77_03435 [Proteobacteria bacterium]|nr:hypothetical protein [Pseudomonadota bacterium]